MQIREPNQVAQEKEAHGRGGGRAVRGGRAAATGEGGKMGSEVRGSISNAPGPFWGVTV